MSPRPRSTLVVVEPGHERAARKLLGDDVLVVNTEGVGPPLVGYRFDLVLRTSPPPERPKPGTFEGQIRTRLGPHARLVVGDLGSLAAILGAIRKLAPWVLEGSPGRDFE